MRLAYSENQTEIPVGSDGLALRLRNIEAKLDLIAQNTPSLSIAPFLNKTKFARLAGVSRYTVMNKIALGEILETPRGIPASELGKFVAPCRPEISAAIEKLESERKTRQSQKLADQQAKGGAA